jgi:dihydrofolate reductase
MRKITAYNFLTLNGFYKGPHGDLSWHKHGGEEAEYAKKVLRPEVSCYLEGSLMK